MSEQNGQPNKVATPVEAAIEKQKIAIAEKVPEKVEKVYLAEADTSLPFTERLDAFLAKKKGTTVRLNDFLKSLYPIPVMGARPRWEDQGEMKRLRVLLDKYSAEGKVEVSNNLHQRLGTFYYGEAADPVTKYHNLATIILETKVL
jgi:hypothetical protein